MSHKDDLIRENELLKAQLKVAERWMRREVDADRIDIQKAHITESTRSHFSNFFEQEGNDILRRSLIEKFGEDVLKKAPQYTLERLMDAEIYWNILQKYPTMDALPIVLFYQKILDAWIEEVCIAPWRQACQKNHLGKKIPIQTTPLERDLENIVSNSYTLSVGRLYQLIKLLRSEDSYFSYGSKDQSNIQDISIFWHQNIPDIRDILVSERFFSVFSALIDREVFSRKRHDAKVTYTDAKILREQMEEIFLCIFR